MRELVFSRLGTNTQQALYMYSILLILHISVVVPYKISFLPVCLPSHEDPDCWCKEVSLAHKRSNSRYRLQRAWPTAYTMDCCPNRSKAALFGLNQLIFMKPLTRSLILTIYQNRPCGALPNLSSPQILGNPVDPQCLDWVNSLQLANSLCPIIVLLSMNSIRQVH